jgi:mannose-6-phosphate isomerase-like protein (cupin superfamily)
MIKHDEGRAVWFLNTLVTYKADKETTSGGFGLIEQLLPPGFEPPLHVHHREDEAFYVLEGRVTFFCNGTTLEAEPGAFVFFPRDLAHRFRVADGGPARMLQLNTPGGFEQFHGDMGEPARARALPEPSAADIAKLQQLATRYGFELLPASHST